MFSGNNAAKAAAGLIAQIENERDTALARVKELEAKLAEAERDARRYRFIRDLKCCSAFIGLNEGHAPNYMSLSDWIEASQEIYVDVDPEAISRMIESNTEWSLQVYPDTPIGFWVVRDSTLDAVIDAAIGAEGGGD